MNIAVTRRLSPDSLTSSDSRHSDILQAPQLLLLVYICSSQASYSQIRFKAVKYHQLTAVSLHENRNPHIHLT